MSNIETLAMWVLWAVVMLMLTALWAEFFKLALR